MPRTKGAVNKAPRAMNKQLPPECRKVLAEAIGYIAPCVKAATDAGEASIECRDAMEWIVTAIDGINKRAAKYFPDMVMPDIAELAAGE